MSISPFSKCSLRSSGNKSQDSAFKISGLLVETNSVDNKHTSFKGVLLPKNPLSTWRSDVKSFCPYKVLIFPCSS